MREESRREGELNEQDLKNVSGGNYGDVMYDIFRKAGAICGTCGKRPYCYQRESGLRDYMKEHGCDSVPNSLHCPYCNN